MKTIKIFFISVVLYAVGIGMARGEEYTKALQGISGSNAIVRDIGNNQSLISYTSEGQAAFCIVTEGSSSANSLYTTFDSVYDVEIYNGEVYFCGCRTTSMGIYGVMGYFSLSSFPSTTIYSFTLPWLKRLKKVDVAWMAERKHVVMTADATDGRGALVDAIHQSSYWEINYTVTDTSNLTRFEDIAVIDSFVVVTGINRGGSVPMMQIYYFAQPTIGGYSIFPANNSICKSVARPCSPVLIERCEGNAFVVAARDARSIVSSDPPFASVGNFFLYAMNGYSALAKVRVSVDTRWSYLKDIKYVGDTRTLELLIYAERDTGGGSAIDSRIYHFDQSLLLASNTITGHSYNNVCISSLDCKANQANHLYACGNETGSPYIVNLLKYNPSVWDSCMNLLGNNADTFMLLPDEQARDFSHLRILMLPDTLEVSAKPVVVNIKCN